MDAQRFGMDAAGRLTLGNGDLTCTRLDGARLTWYGERWHVVDGDGEEIREIHCGDMLAVQVHQDAEAVCARAEMSEDGWYLLDPATLFIRDELEGLRVMAVFD